MRVILMWIGGGLLVAGIAVGFLPVSSGGQGCGSAYHATDGGPFGRGSGDCDAARSSAMRTSVVLMVVALATLGPTVPWTQASRHGLPGDPPPPAR